jgi:hypothetical protein
MSRLGTAAAASLAVCSAGCSIHPVPQDVTGLDTYAIVAQVRCEVRDALKTYVDGALRRRPSEAYLADELKDGKITYKELPARIKDPDLRGVLQQYAGAAVAYDFSLDMTESNNVSGNATLMRPFTRGSDTIGFTVGSDHKRENTRTFTIDDTFERLLGVVPAEYCANVVQTPNYNYPIAGKTRLADTVGTFLDLNQSGNLGMKVGGPKTPTLTDDLQFTTTYTGSLSPGFTFTPIGRAFSWSSVGGKLDATRSDIHRVTIALAMPETGKKVTPLTIAESRQEARNALINASNNRFQVYVQKISNGFTTAAVTASFLSPFFP